MLSPQEVARAVAETRCFPGWIFLVTEDREGLQLRIEADVWNANGPGITTLGLNTYIPPMQNLRQLDEFIHWRIDRILKHEVDEWHRRAGVRVVEPKHGRTDVRVDPPSRSPATLNERRERDQD